MGRPIIAIPARFSASASALRFGADVTARKLLDAVWAGLPAGTRIVAHGVTLETESLLAGAQARLGGTLLRIELSQAAPLGGKRGWKASHPVVQWSVMR